MLPFINRSLSSASLQSPPYYKSTIFSWNLSGAFKRYNTMQFDGDNCTVLRWRCGWGTAEQWARIIIIYIYSWSDERGTFPLARRTFLIDSHKSPHPIYIYIYSMYVYISRGRQNLRSTVFRDKICAHITGRYFYRVRWRCRFRRFRFGTREINRFLSYCDEL